MRVFLLLCCLSPPLLWRCLDPSESRSPRPCRTPAKVSPSPSRWSLAIVSFFYVPRRRRCPRLDDDPTTDEVVDKAFSPEEEARAVVEGRFLSMRGRMLRMGIPRPSAVLATGGGTNSTAILQVRTSVLQEFRVGLFDRKRRVSPEILVLDTPGAESTQRISKSKSSAIRRKLFKTVVVWCSPCASEFFPPRHRKIFSTCLKEAKAPRPFDMSTPLARLPLPNFAGLSEVFPCPLLSRSCIASCSSAPPAPLSSSFVLVQHGLDNNDNT